VTRHAMQKHHPRSRRIDGVPHPNRQLPPIASVEEIKSGKETGQRLRPWDRGRKAAKLRHYSIVASRQVNPAR
jgi:hypothetical protein